MISRREFLKLAGLSTLAFTTGIKIGEFVKNSKPSSIYLTAFLPDDMRYFRFVIEKFNDIVDLISRDDRYFQYFNNIEVVDTFLESDSKPNSKFEKILRSRPQIFGYFNPNKSLFIVQKLEGNISSDIFLKDDVNSIYPPEKISDLFSIRDEIRNQPAKIKMICMFRKKTLKDDILYDENKNVIVEVENEIVEKLPLTKNYKNISVRGVNGNVLFSIEDQKVTVINSSCRNKHCVHSGPIDEIYQNIVCAPNKVMIRIDNV